jgi:hypothetical protein
MKIEKEREVPETTANLFTFIVLIALRWNSLKFAIATSAISARITMNNNTTKARFDAERVEAGYKYLDSLRERMGVGQPAGEGEALERDETAMEKFRRSVGFQFGFVMYSGLDVPTAIDHICASAEVLLAARATQPATAPSGVQAKNNDYNVAQ